MNSILDCLHVVQGKGGSSQLPGPELNPSAAGDGDFAVTNPQTPEDKLDGEEETKEDGNEKIDGMVVGFSATERRYGGQSLWIVDLPAAAEEHGHQGNPVAEGVMNSKYDAVVGPEEMDFPQGFVHA